MISSINGNNFITNTNVLQKKRYVSTVSFGQLELDDTFEKQKDTGFFSKAQEKIGKIRGKILDFYLSLIQKGYKDKGALERIDKTKIEFQQTPEGIRRTNISNETIEKEAQILANKSFDKLDVPKELRPQIILNNQNSINAGGYQKIRHVINIDPISYQGFPELDSAVMHEATHSKEALLRAGIPQKRVDEIVKHELLSNKQAIHLVNGNALTFMVTPKMSSDMKNDFDKFAQENLFVKSKKLSVFLYLGCFGINTFCKDESKKIETLINNHPEFISQYGDKESALKVLMSYSFALNTEYNLFTDTKVGGSFGIKPVKVKELSGEELEQAEKSLADSIPTIIGNLLYSKEMNSFSSMMYLFNPEEVLAETNGRNFTIENCTEELEKEKAKGILTKEKENFLNSQIEFAKSVIEYRIFGAKLLEKELELVMNPTNEELDKQVLEQEQKLREIGQKQLVLAQKVIHYDKLN